MSEQLALKKSNSDEIQDVAHYAREWLTQAFKAQNTERYRFHNLKYLLDVMEEAGWIAEKEGCDPVTRERAVLGALFSWSGFSQGHPAIAEKSRALAQEFLSQANYPNEGILAITDAIYSLHENDVPITRVESIIRDATVSYRAKRKFKKRFGLLREEMEIFSDKEFSDIEWSQYINGVLNSTHFYTESAKQEYLGRIQQNIRSLSEELKDLIDDGDYRSGGRFLERGVDTLLRNQTRYHMSLVSLADRKAQMIIGFNTISLSILFSKVLTQVEMHPIYSIPFGILMLANLITVILAVFVISPTTPKKHRMNDEDLFTHDRSIMTEVIFAEMKYETFKTGIQQTIASEEYVYDSIFRMLYETGKVIKKKFRFLKYAYRIFIFGVVGSTFSFIVIHLLGID